VVEEVLVAVPLLGQQWERSAAALNKRKMKDICTTKPIVIAGAINGINMK
jgi:hypothetical protein